MMEYISTNSGELPQLGLGTYSIVNTELPKIMQAALDMGYTLFDTANKYHNEGVIGEFLSKVEYNRADYLLETKVHAQLMLGNLRYLRLNKKSPKTALRNACNKLRTDYIDIFMIHGFFKNYERYLREFMRLKQSGLIGHVGLCNVNLSQLKRLESMKLLPDVVQVEIHPYYSNKKMIEFCHARNIVVEARSPFAHGDAMEDWEKDPILLEIANAHQSTIPQVILRWMTQQHIIALPRTSNVRHLEENLKSFDISLSEEEINVINSLNKDRSYGYVSSKVI